MNVGRVLAWPGLPAPLLSLTTLRCLRCAACSFGRAGGIPRRLCPILVGLREEVVEGQYTLVSAGGLPAVLPRCTAAVLAPHCEAGHCRPEAAGQPGGCPQAASPARACHPLASRMQ